MSRRPGSYQAKRSEDGMEALSAKLSADLRSSIRALGAFPVLSEAWCDMATALGRIADISEAEAELAKGSCCLKDEVKDERKEGGGKTLWEGEELALRYVLEDGKINVCLRNLVEWREFHIRNRRESSADAKPSMQDSLDSFEKGMGIVLRNAWSHLEALQTTDVPLLVDYITGVIKDAAENPDIVEGMSQRGDLRDRQEVVCLSYLRGLLSRLTGCEEDRVMPHIRSAGTTSCLAKMLHANHEHLGAEAAAVGAEALAYVCDTEDFGMYREEYIPVEERGMFAALKEDFVAELCKDPDQRKRLRPLLDTISYCQRTRARK